MKMFDIDKFILDHVIKREYSLFSQDIKNNTDRLYERIEDKSVLVIGGAGSIGKSFIKALLPFKPRTLLVVDISENGLAELTRDLRSTAGLYIPEDYIPYPMSYVDCVFEKLFRHRGGFNLVVNFSAHKHVRSEKDIYSVEALLQNNIIRTKKLLNLLVEFPPERFFCVSTDKAANPVNVMGASKKIMEELVFSYSDIFTVNTARFANVAFSNGSLPAGFLKRIAKLQPISAPSGLRRYFVSPQESGEICLLACMLGNNREIFFPKLERAQMMTFSDIAVELLVAHGYTPIEYTSSEEAIKASAKLKTGSVEYPVYFSKSDTTGEKDSEEFYTLDETIDIVRFSSMGIITDVAMPRKEKLDMFFNQLNSVFSKSDMTKTEVIQILKEYLPNFEHEEKNRFLDEKM
jgi:FlaA1/EpsC-like NDP-sugar epimerase